MGLVLLLGCPKAPPPVMDLGRCREEVEALFGPQDAAVVALRAVDGGPLFRPEILPAIDAACRAFEDAATDTTLRAKCLSSVPLMDLGSPRATLHTIREALPLAPHDVPRLQRLLLEVEFAVADLVDPTLTRTFVSLPRSSYEGVDLHKLVETAVDASEGVLTAALDDGSEPSATSFRRFSPDGASASVVLGLYDAGEDGGLKEPEHLRALERFQLRAEATPRVAETFTVADDLKLIRRGLKKGIVGEAVLPRDKQEAAQLLLALGLVPGATDFGVRIDTSERVGLIRVHLSAGDRESQDRLAARLEGVLVQEAAPGARVMLCRGEEPGP